MDKTEEYDRASKLTDEELIAHGSLIYRQYDRQGDHFKAGVVQEMWLRMKTEQARVALLTLNEDL